MRTFPFLQHIIQENTPSPKECKKLKNCIDEMLEKIRKALARKHMCAEVMLGGSAAKGTFLKHEFDCDIFIRFSQDYKERDLSDILATILNRLPLKTVRVHGSRDYFKAAYKKMIFEFIPVLNVTKPEQALNVTDMSPLHVAWVKKQLHEQLRKDIILTKLFCKAQRVYGAESYINGFSGHVIDILTIYYGGFIPLLQAAAKWHAGTIIDPEQHNTAASLNASKKSALIIIDPLQPERNAAAALNDEKLGMMVTAAQQFLKMPSRKFFVLQKFSLTQVKKQARSKNHTKELILITALPKKDANPDIQGTKLLKVFEHLNTHLVLHEFKVLKSDWHWDKKQIAYFWFILKKEVLSATTLRMGPPLHEAKACGHFKEKHPTTFVKNNRLYCYVRRQYRKPQVLVKALLKNSYVTERVERIGLL